MHGRCWVQRRAWCLGVVAATLVTAACASPAAPTVVTLVSYDGEWRGATSQGRPFTFRLSVDQRVRTLSFAYNFPGCSGEIALTGLDLELSVGVQYPPDFPGPQPPRGNIPSFLYATGPLEGPDHLQVFGMLTPAGATGFVLFGAYQGCGDRVMTWNAGRV